MIYLLLSFLLGIFIASTIKISSYISLLAFGFFIFFYFKSPKKFNLISLSLIFLFLGFISTNFRNRNIINSEEISIKGQVVENSISNENKYIIRDNKFNYYLLYSDENLKLGDKFSLKARVKRPMGKFNDFDFDYKSYLKSSKIDYILYEESLSIKSRSKLGELKELFRAHTLKSLSYLNDKNKNTMASILLANTDYMDPNLKDNYRQAGISHILAMSGLHIGVLFVLINFILKKLSLSKKLRFGITAFLIFFYIYLSSMPFGALRAYIMILITFYSFISKRKIDKFDALLTSAILILIFNPYAILSASFLLSFFSVAGILLLYRPIYLALPSKLSNKSLALSIAISIMIAPICLYFFSQYSILSIISNIFIVPLITLSIVLAIVMVIFSPFAIIISASVDLLLNISNFLIEYINKISFINISGSINELSILIIYYLFIFFAYNKDSFLKYNKFLRSVFYAFVLVSLFNFTYLILENQNYFRMDFIYVNQGDSTIIRTKNKTIMVDTGGSLNENYRPGEIYTLNYLKSRSIKNIDYLFISHFDEDHVDGLFDIIDYVNIDKVFVSYIEDNPYLNLLKSRGIDTYLLNKNDILKIDKNTYIEVLSDRKEGTEVTDANDKSLVFILNHKNFKTLFTGDISSKVEENLKAEADFLKVAHHGSKTSTSEDFVKRLKPRYATISAGFENSYGHPHEEVLKTLEDNNIKYKSTNKNGMISLQIRDEKIYFTSYDQKDYRFIYYLAMYIILLLIFLLKFGDYFELQTNLQGRN